MLRTRRRVLSTRPVDGCFMSKVALALSDAELVQRCRAGDPEEWNEVEARAFEPDDKNPHRFTFVVLERTAEAGFG